MSERNVISYSFQKEELRTIKNKMLNWLRPFSIFSYLDNNQYSHGPNRYEMIAGAGSAGFVSTVDAFGNDWLFGHLAYDYKNHIEPALSSRHERKTGFGDSFYFRPQVVVFIPFGLYELHVAVLHDDALVVLKQILETSSIIVAESNAANKVHWQYRFDQDSYIKCVEQIRSHIEEGDCYEMNLCTETFAENQHLDPWYTFYKLNTLNPSPFAALYRNEDTWLMCASPERFLYKDQNTILSQPIKGTARRSKDADQDELLKQALYQNPKERAENVMIVDLVRNDLARSCKVGSVRVPELFGVYSFPQVHQLISTVTGEVKSGITNQQILEHAFPMGSMTGAPKMMVMQLIEEYERSRRGLYSGAVGYVTPQGDFDFNVVIRSLLYNAQTKYLSYQTGGAITYDSDPQLEWEEVRLKARAMEQVFL
jgi:para-aminobenzoate synthetase component 1